MSRGIEHQNHDYDNPEVGQDNFSDPKKFENLDPANLTPEQQGALRQHLEDKTKGNEATLAAANINTDNTLKPNAEDREGETRLQAREQMDQHLDSLGLQEWKEVEDPQKSLDLAMERTRQYEIQLDQLGNVGEHSSSADVRDFEKGPDQVAV